MSRPKLSVTEELDFHYLLTLMQPLHSIPEYAVLPELFSVIGAESLITLCKYLGGETVKIPTVVELSTSICALQWFYDVYIKRIKAITSIPKDYAMLVSKIAEVYNAGCSEGTVSGANSAI